MKRIILLVTFVALILSGWTAISQAQTHPQRVDFFVLAGKRADLRLNISRKGVDAAFAEWVQREHPAAAQVATASHPGKSCMASGTSCCVKTACDHRQCTTCGSARKGKAGCCAPVKVACCK